MTCAWADLPRLAIITTGYLATGLLPRRWDPAVSRVLFALFHGWQRRRIQGLAVNMRRVLGDRLGSRDPAALAESYYRFYVEDGWGRLRDLHRNGSEARLELAGEEYVRAALAAGQGAILWGMSFCGGRIPKAALAGAGIPLVHLSRLDHGTPSGSRLGRQILAPIYQRSEERYLSGRIVIPLHGFPSYLNDLKRLLASNGCLSITGELGGRQEVVVPFLNGRGRFATGAPALAHATGAALLTVYGFRLAPWHYRVVVEPPLACEATLTRHEYVRRAVQEYAARLEAHVTAYPAAWQTWANCSRLSEAAG
jgi:lauroyl/myristoyl acyltransferase